MKCSRRSRPSQSPSGRNGAQPSRARRCLARRSEPLTASTVLASTTASTGGFGGNTFPLVSFERFWFWTAGQMTAQEHTRRLITLIFAGRNRMVMIRRELPRTEYAGWVLEPFRTEDEEGSPFRGPCAAIGAAVQSVKIVSLRRLWQACAAFPFQPQWPR